MREALLAFFRRFGERRQVRVRPAWWLLALASVCVFYGAIAEAEAGAVRVNTPSSTESHFIKVAHEVVETEEAVNPQVLVSGPNIIGGIVTPSRTVRIVRFSHFLVLFNDRAGWIFLYTPISRVGPTVPEFFHMNDVNGLVDQESRGLAVIAVCDLDFWRFQTAPKQYMVMIVAKQFDIGNEYGWNGDTNRSLGLKGCGIRSAFQVSGVFFGRALKLSGGPPKRCSEGGDDQARERGDQAIVAINKMNGADDLSPDEASDNEAAFIGITGGLLGGLMTCAVLKRVTDAIFGPEKKSDRDKD
ncbi:MAG TPA: hypothetical protein VNV38_01705 [Stellaceae bacterium]|jgi:hypothetical protein|nr:hypothetical protein [Stellaceae bacterium]